MPKLSEAPPRRVKSIAIVNESAKTPPESNEVTVVLSMTVGPADQSTLLPPSRISTPGKVESTPPKMAMSKPNSPTSNPGSALNVIKRLLPLIAFCFALFVGQLLAQDDLRYEADLGFDP